MSTLAEDYLRECGGNVPMYHQMLTDGQRVGQAFFNSLSDQDKEILRGTTVDPFYKEDGESVHKAIEYLLDYNRGP